MKTLLLPAAALVGLGGTLAEEDVSTRYEEGLELRVSSRTEAVTTFGAMTVTFDGEEMPNEPPEEDEAVTVDTIEFIDRVVAAEDGRRRRVERAFATIHQEERENDGAEVEKIGVLEGRTVRLDVDAEGAVVPTLADDGAEVDARFLDDMELTYESEYLLPPGEVEPGDSWTVDGEVARRYFGLDGGPEWFAEDAEEGDEGPDFEELFADELSGEVEVTFDGPAEYEDQDVWAFSFELSMEGALDGLDPDELGMGMEEDPDNPFGSGEATLEAELNGEGRFWILRDSRLLLASEGEGDVQLGLTLTADLGGHELRAEFAFDVAIENRTTYTLE